MNVDAVGNDFRLFAIPNCGKGQPMQTKRMSNGGPTMRSRARLTGGTLTRRCHLGRLPRAGIRPTIEQLVYLSNLIGADLSLVQPGGGNTSVKIDEVDAFGCSVQALVVKGSGTDLRTIGPAGFTHLYLERLALLKQKDSISDEEMMSLMRGCMLASDRDPLPSVETPLHSLLPARFVAHTHDVPTLSLTDTPSAEEHVRRVFGDSVAFLEYVRPGFPLAKRLAQKFPEGPPDGAKALVMEKHGLAAWGETAKECWENLRGVIGKAEAYVAEATKGKRVFGPVAAPALDEAERRELAARDPAPGFVAS